MTVRENIRIGEQAEARSEPFGPEAGGGDNAVIQDESPRVSDPVAPLKKNRKGRKAVQEFLGGEYLSKEWVTGNIPFFLYLALLAMIYISNTYSTEKKFKDIERTKVQLKELRYHYITAKSELMFQGRQSEISIRAGAIGLKETMHPPFKILYPGNTLTSDQNNEGR